MIKSVTSKLWIVFVAAMITLQLIYLDMFFIEPNWIRVDRVRIVNEKLGRALEGLTVVQLSDLHMERIGYVERSLIGIIEKLRPDLILITGDVVESGQGVQPAVDVLSLFEPRFRTYMVLGEAPGDGWVVKTMKSKMWDTAGVTILNNEAVRLNLKNEESSFFWLAHSASPGSLAGVIKNIPDEDPVIVVNQFPEIIKQAAIGKAELVLAGDTHGGQCGVPVLRKIFPYSTHSVYIAGLFKVRDTLLYVNRGIASQKGIRFLCRPEVTVFEFARKGRMRKPKVLRQDESY